MFHLQIGKGGQATGAPVDNIVPPVNQSFMVEPDKNLLDGNGQPFVKGKPFPAPVTSRPQTLQLVDDNPPEFFPPFPDLFHKFFPAQLVAVQAFLGQHPFNDILGGNPGMVGSGDPEGVITLHFIIAPENILEGGVQGMAHVECPGDIGRGDDHGKRRAIRFRHRPQIIFDRSRTGINPLPPGPVHILYLTEGFSFKCSIKK